MDETRRRAVKIVIQITCQLLWLAGLMVGLSGMYLLLNYRHNGLFFAHTYIILPACLALVSATLLLASGGLGIWVSLRKSALLQGVVDSELAPFSSVFQRYTGRSQDPYSDAVDATQKEGCQVKLEEALLFVLHLIIWSSLAVALVETVGFVSVAQLMRDQPLLEYGILDREWA
ncbi:uncharacterized protein LOC129859783 isoform X3 [Salvelinus fontinalis]|uniref:uncharacterized protein LOC129859783 isoform X3 n=1 Tax=Salvelinus fontinalis TaxID=8038 RepID=UPI00248686AA|nr:uncharacterized protein LOC129859783 isoform X3 [Salvelinus fontinalis]